jgi:nitroreductase
MTMKELVRTTRSFRRFRETPIAEEVLRELVDLARLSASGGNVQPLKYVLSCDPETNAMIFPCTAWAGYLTSWPGPAVGERPMAYITILLDETVSKSAGCDHGIAAQSIVLGAMERGLGACMIGSIARKELMGALEIPESCKVLLIIALGEPAEKVVLEPCGADGSIRYYRDSDDVHHVPKRALDDVIVPRSDRDRSTE